MPTDRDYALMAGAAYTSTRTEPNRIPWPQAQGWTPYWPPTLFAKLLDMGFTIEANSILHKSSGFEARTLKGPGSTSPPAAPTALRHQPHRTATLA
jgi:hypothetical protein